MISNRSKLWCGGIFVAILVVQIPNLSASESSLDWNVVVASEAVVIHKTAAASETLSVGSIVLAGDKLVTQTGGSAVLSRGDDLITMGENSEISITDPQPENGTLIDQPHGTVGYTVTKKATPHFQVTTPLLAALVKGTSFTVSANPSGSSVSVSDGRVEIKDPKSGETAEIDKGHVGSIQGGAHSEIEVGNSSDVASGSTHSPNASDNSQAGTGNGNSGSSGNSNSGGNGNGNSGGNGNGNGGGGNGSGGGNGNGNGGGNGGGNGSGNGGGNGGGNGNGGN